MTHQIKIKKFLFKKNKFHFFIILSKNMCSLSSQFFSYSVPDTCLTLSNATKIVCEVKSWYPMGPFSQSAQMRNFLLSTVFKKPTFSNVNMLFTVQKWSKFSHSSSSTLTVFFWWNFGNGVYGRKMND